MSQTESNLKAFKLTLVTDITFLPLRPWTFRAPCLHCNMPNTMYNLVWPAACIVINFKLTSSFHFPLPYILSFFESAIKTTKNLQYLNIPRKSFINKAKCYIITVSYHCWGTLIQPLNAFVYAVVKMQNWYILSIVGESYTLLYRICISCWRYWCHHNTDRFNKYKTFSYLTNIFMNICYLKLRSQLTNIIIHVS